MKDDSRIKAEAKSLGRPRTSWLVFVGCVLPLLGAPILFSHASAGAPPAPTAHSPSDVDMELIHEGKLRAGKASGFTLTTGAGADSSTPVAGVLDITLTGEYLPLLAPSLYLPKGESLVSVPFTATGERWDFSYFFWEPGRYRVSVRPEVDGGPGARKNFTLNVAPSARTRNATAGLLAALAAFGFLAGIVGGLFSKRGISGATAAIPLLVVALMFPSSHTFAHGVAGHTATNSESAKQAGAGKVLAEDVRAGRAAVLAFPVSGSSETMVTVAHKEDNLTLFSGRVRPENGSARLSFVFPEGNDYDLGVEEAVFPLTVPPKSPDPWRQATAFLVMLGFFVVPLAAGYAAGRVMSSRRKNGLAQAQPG